MISSTQLSDIAFFVRDTVRSDSVAIEDYVTTDSLLQNKNGRTIAENLPPQVASLVAFKRGDVLLANIRPYLKKIWFADCNGGASHDVLVARAKEGVSPEYLYSLLLQDGFFNHVMKAAKGAKMPRGDEGHIMRFPVVDMAKSDQKKVGQFLTSIDRLIQLSRKRIENLEKLAKEIYDYWFVQFDFPDKKGRPYKSSGGKMVYNEQLKREIPEGWDVRPLPLIVDYLFGYPFDSKLFNACGDGVPIVRIRNVADGFTNDFSVEKPAKEYLIRNGDFLIGMDGYFNMNLWVGGDAYLVQRACRLTAKDPRLQGYLRRFIYPIIRQLEAKLQGATVAHLGKSHLDVIQVAIPNGATSALSMLNKCDAAIVKAGVEIRKLIQLREFLLPLLMNGQAKMGG